jgi:predicted CopG family antitoxin
LNDTQGSGWEDIFNTSTYTYVHMSTKTITITEEAYNRLKSRKGENQSFSEVIVQNFPAKRKLSEVLAEIGRDDEMADRIEAASKEMRHSKMREVDL